MDFNSVNNLMRQQLGAIKNLEELLDLDSNQKATHTIPQEDIDLFKDHVERLKKVCETATALSQHYQGLEKKTDNKSSSDHEEANDGDDTVHPLEGTLKEAFDETVKEPPKEKKTRTRKPTTPKVVPEPELEDDLDDLLS